MTFDAIPAGESVFLDSNILLYYFTAHPLYGPPCNLLLDRVARQDVHGIASSQVLGEVVHRLMTIEACIRFGWPAKGIAHRLRRHPSEVQQLSRHVQALDETTLLNIEIIPTLRSQVSVAADVSRQVGLLYGDALIVAFMRDRGLAHLASHDSDFDRVPGVLRYAPV